MTATMTTETRETLKRLRVEIKADLQRIEQIQSQEIYAIMAVGKKLREVKELLPHGQFLPWLEKHFPHSERTAQDYMRIFECFKSAPGAVLERLPERALRQLAGQSVPPEAREEVLRRVADLEKLMPSSVEEIIHRHQDATPVPVAPRRTTETQTVAEPVLKRHTAPWKLKQMRRARRHLERAAMLIRPLVGDVGHNGQATYAAVQDALEQLTAWEGELS